MHIILPNGKMLEVQANAQAIHAAQAIGAGLARAAIAAKVNGTLVDLSCPLKENDTLEIITFDSLEGKSIFWHSSAHILAQAVQELFPDVKIGIGPSIDAGFYYDFDTPIPFTPADLEKIEKRFKEIASRNEPFIRKQCTKQEADTYFGNRGEIYKQELINDIEGDSFLYQQGQWQDLCRGPHIPHTGYIQAVKLLSSAGAYWRGSEKNKMLQRIYGISFPKKALLDEYLTMLQEAQRRDHRIIGKELDLFSFHKEGTGFAFWHPKGMVIYNAVSEFSRQQHIAAGYKEVRTPIILNEELWHRSGHWDKYRDNMYFTEIDDATHAVKPMNCPGGLLIYKNDVHSYKDLPIKNFEFGLVHRHEKSSVLHGLFRVRQFTQDDAHIFCEPEQIEEQISEVIDFITAMYATFGFTTYHIELSTRPEKFIGDIETWNVAETALHTVLTNKKINFKLNPGDGAFYGPKIDFHILDCLKRSWQCGTIQVDFSMPQRFELEYTARNGQKLRPVMIHRALLGSFERFIGIMIEHYAGFLPLWLSPVQIKIIAVSEKYLSAAHSVLQIFKDNSIRAEVDSRNEKIGYKIRDAELNKIPYMAIIGEKEVASNTLSVRQHTKGDQGSMSIDALLQRMKQEITSKKAI